MTTPSTNTNPAPFLYEPLSSRREIRLIKFLPGTTPTCQMITVEVEKAPPYVALSYTWGSRNLEEKLIVNRHQIAITKNLAEAINATFIFAREANLMFWADSICINQADLQERSKQVRLMSTIYRSAELVLVWLGRAANDSDLAFDELREWKSRFDELIFQNGSSVALAMTSIAPDDPYFYSDQGMRVQKAIRMICRRTWWSRAWVVQEGTMTNPSRTLLCCGSRMISWGCLRAALYVTHRVVHHDTWGMNWEFAEGLAPRLDGFRMQRETGAMIRLLDVLGMLRKYECEDPRDKIYAALGMAMDIKEDDIIPDYTKPFPELYCDLVNFSMSSSKTHSLEFLGHVARPHIELLESETDSVLPSWTPDWRNKVSLTPFAKRLDMYSFENKKTYNASRCIVGNWHIETNRLFLEGSILDRVTRVWSVSDHDLRLDCERSCVPTRPDSMYICGGTLLEAYSHTLLADYGIKYDGCHAKSSRGLFVDWELLERDKTKMTAFERKRQGMMLINIKTATFGRRLFETSRGYMGLGAAACSPNDNVCVLFGGQVLYLLREKGDVNHEFIGECYVHGMMDGQALEDESFSKRDFVLV